MKANKSINYKFKLSAGDIVELILDSGKYDFEDKDIELLSGIKVEYYGDTVKEDQPLEVSFNIVEELS